MKGYIYMLRVEGVKWVYIGETLHPKRRLWEHKNKKDANCASAELLLYGSPEMIILEEVEAPSKTLLKGLMRAREAHYFKLNLSRNVLGFAYMNEVKGVRIPDSILARPL